jgi:DNA-binding NtrC family response regulator
MNGYHNITLICFGGGLIKKILLVDDAVEFLKVLKQALEKDFDVQTATGVSEALSLIDNGDIELICSDLDMRDGTKKQVIF